MAVKLGVMLLISIIPLETFSIWQGHIKIIVLKITRRRIDNLLEKLWFVDSLTLYYTQSGVS